MLRHRSAVGKQIVTHQLWRTKSGDSNNLPLLFDATRLLVALPFLQSTETTQHRVQQGQQNRKKGSQYQCGAPPCCIPGLSVDASVDQSIYMSVYLSIFIYPSISLSLYLSVYLSIYRSNFLSLSIYLCLSVYLSIYLAMSLPIYFSICLGI